LAENLRRVQALDGLSQVAFNWRPGEARWSVGSCVEHLNRTAAAYLARLVPAMKRARADAVLGTGPFRHGRLGNWFVRQLEPPPKRRLPSPEFAAVPGSAVDRQRTLEAFAECHRALDRALAAADGLHLEKVRVRSPVSPLIRFDLGQCFSILVAHERRHLWQIDRVLESPGYPG
jgi:hypothetical protein